MPDPDYSLKRILLELGVVSLLMASAALELSVELPLGLKPLTIHDPLSSPVVLAIAVTLFLARARGWSVIGFHRTFSPVGYAWRTLGLVLLYFAIHVPAMYFIVETAGLRTDYRSLSRLIDTPQIRYVTFLLILPTFAFLEEFVYRAFLIDRLERLFGGPGKSTIAAVFVSSVIFGVVHAQFGAGAVAGSAVSGLFFAVVYCQFGRSLWLPTLVHWLTNVFSLLMMRR